MDEQSKSLSIVSERMNSFVQQPQQKLNGSNSNSNSSSKASVAEVSSSRRVSMDSMINSIGGGNPQSTNTRDSAPHTTAATPLRRGSGPDRVTIDDCSPSDPSAVGARASNDTSSSLAKIPPTGGGFGPRVDITRRSSAPGFYSSAPSPHLPGMNYLPFPAAMPPASRRSSYAGGFLNNNNNMLFPGPPPPGGMMIPSMDGFPSMPFPNAGSSSMMIGGRNDSTPSPSMDGSGRGDEMGSSSQNSRRGSLGSSMSDKTIRRSRPSCVSSFPMKLHRILSDNEYSDFVAWLPHGRAWRILKQKSFEKEVIPRFFRSARYASFMRQVNGWGFKRITEGADLNAYYHESFLRGLPELCAEMRRPAKGDGGVKGQKTNKEDPPPDFYKISMIAPLPPPTCKPAPGGETTTTTRPTLSPRPQRPHGGGAHTPPRLPPPLASAMTTDFSAVDSERYRYVEPADDDDHVLTAPGMPRNHYQHQQYHQHSRDPSHRPPMTPTPRDSNEISPAQEAFLSYTPMAEVASVSSDFDNEGDHWVESPFNTTYIAPGTAPPAAAAAAEHCKPQAIPSASGDEFLSIPSEIKILSPGESLRNSPDKDFLTKADLNYLEHQNKFLLEQSGMFIHRRDHREHQQRGPQASCPDPFEEGPLDDDDEEQQQQQHTHHPDLGPMEE